MNKCKLNDEWFHLGDGSNSRKFEKLSYEFKNSYLQLQNKVHGVSLHFSITNKTKEENIR